MMTASCVTRDWAARLGSLTLMALLALPAQAGTDLAGVAVPGTAPGEVLKVTNYTDDGSPGTLRWALQKNNADPGQYRIELAVTGDGPHVIRVQSALPPIKGPVVIDNVSHDRDGRYVVVDGADYIGGTDPQDCPGAVDGQFGTNVRTTSKPGLVLRDTRAVEIHGLEIRNFCIGVLVNRASGNLIHDNRIVHNIGGSGVMLTGDDGQGNSTATTTVHNKILNNTFVDNGDAMEATRGAAFNLIAGNRVTSSDQRNNEPSQGLEILWGNDNIVVNNHFEHLSDGVQLNWGNRNYISGNTFTALSSGVTLSGTGNIVAGNTLRGNRVAVAVRPQPVPPAEGEMGAHRVLGASINTISANRMIDNGQDIRRCYAGGSCLPQMKGAIVFNVPGLEHGQFEGNRGGGVETDSDKLDRICALDGPAEGCQETPNRGQKAPELLAVNVPDEGPAEIEGELAGLSDSLYRVELFANRTPGETEAEAYLGFIRVALNDDGKATFRFPLAAEQLEGVRNVTATATTPDGATSMLSEPLAL
ncbi:NosD domain-containing protein [Marinobacter sp. JSM 1782161]|uniref:NosD domain-containing protein n=1 Tax=Marinobacter sp. JSM 1782161 TaxID=2685906 RepID=UPI001A9DAE38|nr:NosD domain-containing protein [Marinobacter sp. JSM 1782161]